MTAGSAYTTAAAAAGARPTANSATTGIRYTNCGMVCMTSSTGRRIASRRLLPAARMPTAKPSTRVTARAARTWERVFMDGFQTPRTPMAAIASVAVSAVRQVPISQASAATISSAPHQGSAVRPSRSGSRTQEVKCAAQSAVPPTTGTPE